jgi:hypothetical protein
MQDLDIIEKLNAEAVARWKPTPNEPYAVVHKAGLNVLSITPMPSKALADELVGVIQRGGSFTGETAQII